MNLPTLQAPPRKLACLIREDHAGVPLARCVLVLEEDWAAVVRRMKALCLVLGGDPVGCQTADEP